VASAVAQGFGGYKSEMSDFIFRLLAGCHLPSGKHEGILTYFQTKFNKKIKNICHRGA